MTGLFLPLPPETRKALESLPGLIDKVFPLPARFRAALPRDVAELSWLLTSGRSGRSASYLGKPALLSAYLRYFLPWNIYRICRLFGSLPLELKPHDAVNDLGAGPLTLAAALWISRPDLRGIPLEFRCLDRTPAVLEAGKKFFAALAQPCADAAGWSLRCIRGELRQKSLSAEIRGKKAALSAAVNVYNELFWNFSPADEDENNRFAENQARLLSSLTESAGSVLVVEPGIPRSGEFISLLRSCLMEEGRFPLSPCPHTSACPMPDKAKWCHFTFGTEDAPEELHRLSAASHIPKERASLSFIFAGGENKTSQPAAISGREARRAAEHTAKRVKVRCISDCFPLSGNLPAAKARFHTGAWGRYACGERGLVLVSGSRNSLEAFPSGALEEITLTGAIDAKSGALVAIPCHQT